MENTPKTQCLFSSTDNLSNTLCTFKMVIILDFSQFLCVSEIVPSDHLPANHLPKSCTPNITADNTITDNHISLLERMRRYLVSLSLAGGQFIFFSLWTKSKYNKWTKSKFSSFHPFESWNEVSGAHRIVYMWERRGLTPTILPDLAFLYCRKVQRDFSHLWTFISYHRKAS